MDINMVKKIQEDQKVKKLFKPAGKAELAVRDDDAKTQEISAAAKGITQEMVSDWVGNYGDSEVREQFMLDTLTELANGSYPAERLAEDIKEYAE